MCILDAVLRTAIKYIPRFLLFTYVVLYATYASGQGFDIYRSHLHNLKVEQINADDGLSQGMVNSLAFDKAGYMWVGTKDGLNRYDGISFKVYHHNPDDSSTMQKNYVEHVNIDSKGGIWVTYSGGGLDFFDKSTETFVHISSKISARPLGFLCETDKGDILANSIDGVYKVEVHEKIKTGVFDIEISDYSSVYPFDMDIFRYAVHPYKKTHYTNDGNILVGNFSFRLDNQPFYFFTKRAIEHKQKPIVRYEQTGSCFLSGDRIYFYDNTGHFQELDGDSLITIATVSNARSEITPFADRDNNIWFFNNASEDIMRLSKDDNSIDTFQLEWPNVPGHLNRAVFDTHGNIWVPSAGFGIYKLKPGSARFHKLNLPNSGRGYSLRISVAANSRLFDSKINDSWFESTKGLNHRIGYVKLNGLMYDRDRSLIMQDNSDEACLQLLTITKDKHIEFETVFDAGFKDSGYLYLYRSSFLDNHNNIWTGITIQKHGSDKHDEYIARIDDNKISDRHLFPEIIGPLRGGYHFISDVLQRPDDKIWFATASGVYSFKPGTKTWEHWKNIPGDTTSLSDNATICITPDPHEPERFFWVGTDGAGLNKLDITTGTCRRFTVEDGLPNNVIYNILVDAHDNLWMSTNKGLCLFNTRTFETRNFTVKDGLRGNEFNKYAASMDSSGRMYFNYAGAYASSIYFDPEDFYSDTLHSTTVINKLKLFNRNVDYIHNRTGVKSEYQLPAAVEECFELVFSHNQGMITLGYVVLDLTNPEDNVYRYKMEGFNDDWIYAGTQTEATFTNLAPGTYTFMVVGRNSYNVWSKEPASIKIIILAPWWATWWFRLCVLLAIAGVLYGIYRIRMSQLLGVERMRNDIAQDLHDEIGSTLSSISLYTTVMKKTTAGLSPKSTILLEKIDTSTSEMMEGMNDIVWATKPDNDSFEQVVDRMRAFAASTTEAKGIKLEFDVEKKAERVKVSMHQRKNIYMLFKEAVNNAIKHAQCDKIIISIILSDKNLQISISDNGIGFDSKEQKPNNASLGGNGLEGMERRAQQIAAKLSVDSAAGKGTTITLVLTLK